MQDIYRIQDTRIQRYKDTRIQGYKDTRIQGYKDTRIQGYKDTRIQGYKDNVRTRTLKVKGGENHSDHKFGWDRVRRFELEM